MLKNKWFRKLFRRNRLAEQSRTLRRKTLPSLVENALETSGSSTGFRLCLFTGIPLFLGFLQMGFGGRFFGQRCRRRMLWDRLSGA